MIRKRRVYLGLGLLCFAAQISAKTLEYTSDTATAEAVLPEGCDNPFVEAKTFFNFYENTIGSLAADRGADAKGVAELFAVSELASDLSDMTIQSSEENPIDRLVQGQLCHFQKAIDQNRDLRVKKKTGVLASDVELHNHLLKISPKLFKDSLALFEGIVAKKALDEQRKKALALKQQQIRRARSLGRSKIDQAF